MNKTYIESLHISQFSKYVARKEVKLLLSSPYILKTVYVSVFDEAATDTLYPLYQVQVGDCQKFPTQHP